MMEIKNAAFELKREPDDDGHFEGYASVFGIVDQGNDVVERGAFEKSLAVRAPKMLWQHDPEQPIGVWDEVREDERGLFVKGRLLKEVPQARSAMALLRAKAMDGLSIGYKTIEAVAEGAGDRVRKLMEVELWEVSLVTFAMLPQAQVTDIKSITTIREFEKSLRDVGFSQNEAKAIAADGFKGLADHRDDVEVGPDTGEMIALNNQLTKLTEAFNA